MTRLTMRRLDNRLVADPSGDCKTMLQTHYFDALSVSHFAFLAVTAAFSLLGKTLERIAYVEAVEPASLGACTVGP